MNRELYNKAKAMDERYKGLSVTTNHCHLSPEDQLLRAALKGECRNATTVLKHYRNLSFTLNEHKKERKRMISILGESALGEFAHHRPGYRYRQVPDYDQFVAACEQFGIKLDRDRLLKRRGYKTDPNELKDIATRPVRNGYIEEVVASKGRQLRNKQMLMLYQALAEQFSPQLAEFLRSLRGDKQVNTVNQVFANGIVYISPEAEEHHLTHDLGIKKKHIKDFIARPSPYPVTTILADGYHLRSAPKYLDKAVKQVVHELKGLERTVNEEFHYTDDKVRLKSPDAYSHYVIDVLKQAVSIEDTRRMAQKVLSREAYGRWESDGCAVGIHAPDRGQGEKRSPKKKVAVYMPSHAVLINPTVISCKGEKEDNVCESDSALVTHGTNVYALRCKNGQRFTTGPVNDILMEGVVEYQEFHKRGYRRHHKMLSYGDSIFNPSVIDKDLFEVVGMANPLWDVSTETPE